jgi:hypothetical protein
MSTLPQRRTIILLTLLCLYEIISLSYKCACQQEIDPDDLAWTSWRPRGPSPTSNPSPPSSSALLFPSFLSFTVPIESIPSSHTSTYSSWLAGKKQQETNKTDSIHRFVYTFSICFRQTALPVRTVRKVTSSSAFPGHESAIQCMSYIQLCDGSQAYYTWRYYKLHCTIFLCHLSRHAEGYPSPISSF